MTENQMQDDPHQFLMFFSTFFFVKSVLSAKNRLCASFRYEDQVRPLRLCVK
jgi:hypothetical protein